MGLYDAIKDVANIAQKADNIELYRQLLDLGAQALEMQAEIARLREENKELKKQHDLQQRIVRHNAPYITLSGEPSDICYCATCWGKNQSLIQMLLCEEGDDVWHFGCRNCGNAFFSELDK